MARLGRRLVDHASPIKSALRQWLDEEPMITLRIADGDATSNRPITARKAKGGPAKNVDGDRHILFTNYYMSSMDVSFISLW